MADSSGDPKPGQQRPSAPMRASTAVPAQRQSAAMRAQGGRGGSRAQRTIGWRTRDIVRAAALVLAVYYGAQLFWVGQKLFFVVFLGILFGIAVSGGVDRLQRFRIPRAVAATLIVVSGVGLLVGFGAWVAPTLKEQGTVLRQKLPEAADRVQDWIKKRQNGVLGILLPPDAAPIGAPQPGVAPAQPTVVVAPTAGDSGGVSQKIQDQVRARMPGLSRYLFPFLTSTVEVLGGLVLILFLAIYFAAEPDLYRRGLLSFIPARKRARGAVVLSRTAEVLRKWLLTQLIAMVVIGTVTTIVLLLLKVKAAFALGVLAGLFEFIPTIGPILSAVPAIAMAFLDSPEKALTVALAYVAIQFLENHLLIPILMKQGIELPPALTVVAQTLFALIFGFVGLMVAVPAVAMVIVFIRMFYLEQLPAEGTWTYPTFSADLDEPLEGSKPAKG